MPLWRLFYHMVWTTQYRERRIDEVIEPFVYQIMREKVSDLGGNLFALNGMPDHVHLVTSVPPKIAVAHFVGQVKGYSSIRLNQSGLVDRPFSWQDEYAVFSLDSKRLPGHVAYVENQKLHHSQATVIPALERTSDAPT